MTGRRPGRCLGDQEKQQQPHDSNNLENEPQTSSRDVRQNQTTAGRINEGLRARSQAAARRPIHLPMGFHLFSE